MNQVALKGIESKPGTPRAEGRVEMAAVPVRTGKKRVWFLAVGGVVAIIVVLAGIKAMQIKKMTSTPMVMPPTTVSSAIVKEENWTPILSSVGTVSAVQGALMAGKSAEEATKSIDLASKYSGYKSDRYAAAVTALYAEIKK